MGVLCVWNKYEIKEKLLWCMINSGHKIETIENWINISAIWTENIK